MARFLRKTLQIAAGGSAENKPIYIEFTEDDIGAFAYNINYIWFSTSPTGGINGNYVYVDVPFDWKEMEIVNDVLTFKGWIRPNNQSSNVTVYLFASNDQNTQLSTNYYAKWYYSNYNAAQTWNSMYEHVYHLSDGKDALTTEDVLAADGSPTFVPDDGVFSADGCFSFNNDGYLYDSDTSSYGNVARECFFKPGSMTTGDEHVVLAVPGIGRVSLIQQSANFFKVAFTGSGSGTRTVMANAVYLSPTSFHHLSFWNDSGWHKVYLNGNNVLSVYDDLWGSCEGLRIGGTATLATVSSSYGDVYSVGEYTLGATINGQPSYTRNSGSYYLWYDNDYPLEGGGTAGRWVISSSINYIGYGHWVSSSTNMVGEYVGVNGLNTNVNVIGPTKNFIGKIDEARITLSLDESTYTALAGLTNYNATHFSAALGPAEELSFTYNETASGGVKASGSAYIPGQIYQNTMSGGVQLSGRTTTTYDQTMSGGVGGNGHGSQIYPTVIMQGGVIGVGEATSRVSIYMDGGVILNGIAESKTTCNISFLNGAKAGGLAQVTSYESVPTSGGVLAGGGSPNSHGYATHGGLILDGEAAIKLTCNPTPQGGTVLSGDSWVDPYVMLTQAFVYGEAIVQVTYPINVTDVATKVGGLALVEIGHIMDGGVGVSGAATELTRHLPTASGGLTIQSGPGEQALIGPYWDTAEGGASLGGIAVVDPEVMSGGIKGSGAADICKIHQPQLDDDDFSIAVFGRLRTNYLSGGEVVPPEFHNNTAFAACALHPVTNLFSFSVSFTSAVDTIRILGPASEGQNSGTVVVYAGSIGGYNSPCAGSVILTAPQRTQLLANQWYWEIQFQDGTKARAQIMPRLGIDTGGTASTGRTLEEASVGEIRLSGTANVTERHRNVGSGGIAVSGEMAHTIKQTTTLSGGAKLNGTATTSVIYQVQTSGGAQSGGSWIEQTIYTLSGLGVVALQGQASIGIGAIMSGGVMLHGDHAQNYILWPRSEGGASISPMHRQTFYDWYEAVGTVKVGGKTLPSRIQVWQTQHFGYGRAMGSENIFTVVDETPLLTPPTNDVSPELSDSRYRIQHEPGWCDVEEKCDEGVLPKIVQRRQGIYLPPKIERVTRRDRGIATADAL